LIHRRTLPICKEQQMNQLEYMAMLMRERFATFPPMLKIPQVAEALMEDVPTIRARIRRKKFQITVRHEDGHPQYVLLADLVRFLCDGEIQPQPEKRLVRKPRNPLGISGKKRPGRPTKSEQLRNDQARVQP